MTRAQACRHTLLNTWLRCPKCHRDRWRVWSTYDALEYWVCFDCGWGGHDVQVSDRAWPLPLRDPLGRRAVRLAPGTA